MQNTLCDLLSSILFRGIISTIWFQSEFFAILRWAIYSGSKLLTCAIEPIHDRPAQTAGIDLLTEYRLES
jgi:hypothetical protein